MTATLKICLQTVLVIALSCCAMSMYGVKDVKKVNTAKEDYTWESSLRQNSHINETEEIRPAEPSKPTPKKKEPNCICSKIYDPICASNNQSYFNICFFECKVPPSENATVVHQGNCIPYK